MAAKNNVVAIATPVKPTIAQIAAMTKAERAAYIAARTGAQPDGVELDLGRLAKNTADKLIAGAGCFAGTVKEIASGAKSSFQAGYLSALDD